MPDQGEKENTKITMPHQDKPPSLECFPSNAKVVGRTGPKPIAEVEVSDEILCLSDDGTLKFSPVYTICHREPDAEMEVVVISTTSKTSITLSPGHYMPKRNGRDIMYVQAGTISEGDRLLIGQKRGFVKEEVVVEVKSSFAVGKQAVLTLDGTLVVDGIVASNYEHNVPPALAHKLLAPLRQLYRWLPSSVAMINKSISKEGIPTWAMFCLRYLVPYLPTQRFQ